MKSLNQILKENEIILKSWPKYYSFTEAEVDILTDAIELAALSYTVYDLEQNPNLRARIDALESAGLKLGMEMGEEPEVYVLSSKPIEL